MRLHASTDLASSSYQPPPQRPWRDAPIDVAAIARWNHANKRARRAYYADTRGLAHQANPPDRSKERR